MEEKTILEWFEWAKEQGYEWAEEAINNNDRHGATEDAPTHHKKLSDALLYGFSWRYCINNKGFDYWNNIHNSLEEQNL